MPAAIDDAEKTAPVPLTVPVEVTLLKLGVLESDVGKGKVGMSELGTLMVGIVKVWPPIEVVFE